MEKKLILGLGAIATTGAIAGGVYLSQNNPFNLEPSPDTSTEDQQKIEKLYFEELQDKERYTFCQGKEKITGTYKNSIVGSESGQVDYRSEDISVFDKENQKLYILGRTIDYKYHSQGNLSNLIGEGSLETKESGNITEYYKKNMAPVRLDYNANILYPAPDRKRTDWVMITTKGIGAVMGLAQERVDEETGDAKVLCPYFSLAGGALKNGAIVTPDSFSFQGTCPDNSPNPGVSFSGNFEFECNNIGSSEGIDLLKNYEEKEELSDFKGIINSQEKVADPEALRVKLEEMKKEMQADQRAN
ncbi:MAG: hypothetical protein WC531_00475 [Candidatus Paceibacterota bacterium]|jgi:hypothetical protein